MSRNTYKNIYYFGVVALWIATMSVLVYRHYGPSGHAVDTPSSAATVPEELFEEQWMGMYQNNKKVGYSLTKFDRTKRGYMVLEKIRMSLTVMKSRKEIESEIHAYLDPFLQVSSFDFSLRADSDMKVRCNIEGRELRLSIETEGSRSERVVTLREVPSLSLSLIPRLLQEGMQKGRKMKMPVLDPATLSLEEMEIEVVGREPVYAMGLSQRALKIKCNLKGTVMSVWVTEKGTILKEESPLGFVMIKESREDALRPAGRSSDLIELASVPFNLRLPDITRHLEVRLSGIDYKWFDLDGGGQRLRGDVLEIDMEQPEKDSMGDVRPPGEEYLGDSSFVQSRDKEIKALAGNIVKGEKDPTSRARLIYSWVYNNIEKTPSFTVPVATEVLRTRKGDCNEHTALYTSLARAAGIPARTVLGLVYRDRAFYYHAWPEIFAGRWIAVDPTLGQFPADASHIRLVIGDLDKQMQIVSAMGKIRLEGLNFR